MFYLIHNSNCEGTLASVSPWGGGGMATHRLKCSLLSNCRISIFIGDYQEFRKHRSLFRKRKTIVNKDSKSTSTVARPEHCA